MTIWQKFDLSVDNQWAVNMRSHQVSKLETDSWTHLVRFLKQSSAQCLKGLFAAGLEPQLTGEKDDQWITTSVFGLLFTNRCKICWSSSYCCLISLCVSLSLSQGVKPASYNKVMHPEVKEIIGECICQNKEERWVLTDSPEQYSNYRPRQAHEYRLQRQHLHSSSCEDWFHLSSTTWTKQYS